MFKLKKQNPMRSSVYYRKITIFSGVFECPSDFYKCPKSFCIEKQFVCDGVPQCENGEDELHCGK